MRALVHLLKSSISSARTVVRAGPCGPDPSVGWMGPCAQEHTPDAGPNRSPGSETQRSALMAPVVQDGTIQTIGAETPGEASERVQASGQSLYASDTRPTQAVQSLSHSVNTAQHGARWCKMVQRFLQAGPALGGGGGEGAGVRRCWAVGRAPVAPIPVLSAAPGPSPADFSSKVCFSGSERGAVPVWG